MSYNVVDNTELKNICEALSTNPSLKSLYLCNCSLTISDDNGAALYQLLNTNNSLEHLNLSGNTVTSCRHIAAGLAVNKTLRTLDLDYCKLTDQSIEELSTGLINKIETLYINGNDSITEDGMKTLARHLTTHCSELTLLWIPDHLESCIETVFRDANEERKRNRLPEINYSFEFGVVYIINCCYNIIIVMILLCVHLMLFVTTKCIQWSIMILNYFLKIIS